MSNSMVRDALVESVTNVRPPERRQISHESIVPNAVDPVVVTPPCRVSHSILLALK